MCCSCCARRLVLVSSSSVHNVAPMYITDLISVYEPGRQLRSASRSLLTVPRHNLERFGRRGFSVNAPHLWDDLPDNLRLIDSVILFKRHLNPFRLSFSEPKCAPGRHILFLESIFQHSPEEIVHYSINHNSYNKKVYFL